jgi:hypothetical protein
MELIEKPVCILKQSAMSNLSLRVRAGEVSAFMPDNRQGSRAALTLGPLVSVPTRLLVRQG